METQYFKEYSPALGREMECKVYGHAGRPVLFIPCQDGRFFDFENFKMTDVWAPWIESGQVMVFSIDTMDLESWSDKGGDPYWRIRRYEQWIDYITREMVPFIRGMANERNGWTGYPGIAVFGCSLGATHAANLYFRFPDLFDGLLALSGIYTAEYGFGDYMDEVVYRNSPVHYLADMPAGHPFIARYIVPDVLEFAFAKASNPAEVENKLIACALPVEVYVLASDPEAEVYRYRSPNVHPSEECVADMTKQAFPLTNFA